LLSLVFFCNAQYVFTGNGAWSDANNWQNGIKPPSTTISSGATVTIQGAATTSSGFPYDLAGNNGSLIITAGGSLSINIETQFSNAGIVTVNGSLTSNTMWEAYNGSSITINGIFNNQKTLGNQGLITVNNGGVINNTSNLDNRFVNPIGQIVLNCGGTINNSAVFKPGNLTVSSCGVINNSSTLTGNSTISGSLVNGAILAPGNSPGNYSISGDYTATSTAIHNFEVAGTAAGNYDVLNIGGNVSLNGTLNVSLINGFAPTTSHDLAIITGTITGTFSTVNIPSSYTIIYNPNSVVLRHTDEYTFIGNGDWNDPANWAGGKKSGNVIPSGSYVYINGTAQTCSSYCNDLSMNSGNIIVSASGSLTIQADTAFVNTGNVTVFGTLINKRYWESDKGSAITIYGTFENQNSLSNAGTITVKNGGGLKNTGSLDNTFVYPPDVTAMGQIALDCGSTLNNQGTFKPGNLITSNCITLTNSATLSGNSTINGNLINAGTLSPGNSPGTYTINGDYTATSAAVHNFEVAGTISSLYDVLNVSGNASLNGTLNVSIINGFTPSTDHDLPIIAGTINGTFETVNIPSSYILLYNANSVVLRHTSTLPVNFVSVSLKKQNNGQLINWNIQNEENVLRYEIEKSKEGSSFIKIGFVNAAGQNSYNFSDLLSESKCFYRIKSVDINGSYKYSSIIVFSQGNSFVKLNVFPSPTKNKITVQHSTATANSRFLIISTDGKIVKTVRPSSGVQQTEIDLSLLRAGMYIVQFENGKEQKQILKVQKL
jgi:hypothetical protein